METRGLTILVLRSCLFALALLAVAAGPAGAGNPFAGKKVWDKHGCANCHGVDGKPLMPAIPDFSKGERLNKSDRELMIGIQRGGDVMPTFEGLLTKRELEDVVVYVRTLFR